MRRKQEPRIKEGDVFTVGITCGQVIGLAARWNDGILTAFFFDPVLAEIQAEQFSPDSLRGRKPVAIYRTGLLGFSMDGWKVIGAVTNWHRSEWPLPAFGVYDIFEERLLRCVVMQDEGLDSIGEAPMPATADERPPSVVISGHRSVTMKLSRLLCP